MDLIMSRDSQGNIDVESENPFQGLLLSGLGLFH